MKLNIALNTTYAPEVFIVTDENESQTFLKSVNEVGSYLHSEFGYCFSDDSAINLLRNGECNISFESKFDASRIEDSMREQALNAFADDENL